MMSPSKVNDLIVCAIFNELPINFMRESEDVLMPEWRLPWRDDRQIDVKRCSRQMERIYLQVRDKDLSGWTA